jgi:hypothetical protein
VVLTTGFASLDEAIDAAKRNIHETPGEGADTTATVTRRLVSQRTDAPGGVEREHIVRTLAQVRG